MQNTKQIIKGTNHIVVRFSDSLFEGISTIREHELIIKNKGSVWFGKLGRPLAKKKIDILNKQINSNEKTYLLLVQKKKKGYMWTQAVLDKVANSVGKNEIKLTPPYYKQHDIDKQSSVWFKVSKLYTPPSLDMKKCYIVSSNNPIDKTLYCSMYSMFMVYFANKGSQKKLNKYKTSFEEALLNAFEEEYDEY